MNDSLHLSTWESNMQGYSLDPIMDFWNSILTQTLPYSETIAEFSKKQKRLWMYMDTTPHKARSVGKLCPAFSRTTIPKMEIARC